MSRSRRALAVIRPTLSFAVLLAAATAAADPAVPIENPAMPAPPAREVPEGHSPPLTEADLAPYLSDAKGQAAQKLFNDGRYREALAALQKLPASPHAEYLKGLCLLHLGRAAEAGTLFSGLAGALAPLASRCHFHAAVAFEDAGQLDAAAREYAAVAPEAVVWGEAQLGLARVRRNQHDYPGALAAVAPLVSRPWSSAGRDLQAEALVFTAQVANLTGDKAAAKDADLRLWSEHPLAKISDAALADAKRLGVKEPTNVQKLRRAEVLLESNRNEPALAMLKPLLQVWKIPDADGCRVRFLYGKALRKQRQHAAALDALDPVITSCTADAGLRARAMYVAGSSASIIAPERGVVIYTALAKAYPDHPFADDALFFAADLQQKAGRYDQERSTLSLLVDSPAYRDGDFRAEGLFRLYWIARLEKKPEAGLPALERIINEYGGARPAEVERAEYWRARTLQELGHHEQADLGYAALVRAHPTSYYALLARSRLSECHGGLAGDLAKSLESLPPPAPPTFQPGRLRDESHFQAAMELYRMGLNEEAGDELVAVPREKLRGDESDALRLIVELLARAGNPRSAQAIARTELSGSLSGPPTSSSLNLWQAAYPLAFRPELQKSCTAAQVEPDLFQALIREESALDPHIVSWAGAVGLSQLMPATAKSVARELRIKGKIDLERLQEPELNLRLGSAYVGSLLKRFSNNPALALAAYNAGAGAVGNWLKDRGSEDLDAFVEEIPIAETRAYVKRVLQSYNVYQLLYARRAQARLPRHTLPPPKAPRTAAAPAPASAAGSVAAN